MAKQVQYRRGTTVQHSGFVGVSGEITVDTTKNTVVIHDGVTAGGIPLARATGEIYTGNLLMTSNSRIGLGTTSPAHRIDILESSSAATARVRTTNVGANARLLLTTDVTGTAEVRMGDQNNDGAGIVAYNNTDDSLLITVNATEAFRITSTGQIGVNKSVPLEFFHIEPTGSASDTNGLRYTAFRPHITLEDKTSSSTDFQIWVDAGVFEILHGDISVDDKLPTSALTIDLGSNLITISDETLVEGDLELSAATPSLFLDDESGTVDSRLVRIQNDTNTLRTILADDNRATVANMSTVVYDSLGATDHTWNIAGALNMQLSDNFFAAGDGASNVVGSDQFHFVSNAANAELNVVSRSGANNTIITIATWDTSGTSSIEFTAQPSDVVVTKGVLIYRHTDKEFRYNDSGTVLMRIDGTNESFLFNVSTSITPTDTRFRVDSNVSNDIVGVFRSSDNSFNAAVNELRADRSASSGYSFLQCQSDADGANDTEFNFRGDGNGFADGAFTGGGADYAEYFESVDGSTIFIGDVVVLDGEKIRAFDKAKDKPKNIIGVVRPKSSGSSVIADAAWNHWSGKYLKDKYGAYKHNEAGERILNPDYEETPYIPREQRDEWHVIGLVGKVVINKGQPTKTSWQKLKDLPDDVALWLVGV